MGQTLLESLYITITDHLAPQGSAKFPSLPFLRLALVCTIGLTLPALLWFVAITLASISDVTAIWNTNAFFAYVIAVKLFGLKWEPRRLLAVLLATLGVIVVVYGGSTSNVGEPSIRNTGIVSKFIKPSAPLVGDLLTLIASISYGLYQVLYKKYAAISTDPDDLVVEDSYDRVPNEDPAATQFDTAVNSSATHTPPFGLHANFLTSSIGLLTCLILWLPIPFLHYSGVELFRLPPNFTTVLAITGISLNGVVFNAGFMASSIHFDPECYWLMIDGL
ncbi:hypothetical protein DXG01_000226 [Tephrocybe rancida]|nr:hypothetical protein DXG01_000226 [Tephrocybe rancida]